MAKFKFKYKSRQRVRATRDVSFELGDNLPQGELIKKGDVLIIRLVPPDPVNHPIIVCHDGVYRGCIGVFTDQIEPF